MHTAAVREKHIVLSFPQQGMTINLESGLFGQSNVLHIRVQRFGSPRPLMVAKCNTKTHL